MVAKAKAPVGFVAIFRLGSPILDKGQRTPAPAIGFGDAKEDHLDDQKNTRAKSSPPSLALTDTL